MASVEDEHPQTSQVDRAVHLARWVAAVIYLVYGFAKLNGAQFTVLDSELTKPMGEVSGIWLTWYYFGYSKAYGSLIAGIQIGGGVLLMWKRSSLVGALVLLPVAVNIVLTDIFFGVNALGMALLVLGCLLIVIAPHIRGLLRAVLLESSEGVGRVALLAGFWLAATWGFTYWIANSNNRAPTVIDGTWEADGDSSSVANVFFEYNRAHLVVFRSADGRDTRGHFEVDSAGGVQVWAFWRRKGALVYTGQVMGPNRVELWPETPSGDTIRLTRKR